MLKKMKKKIDEEYVHSEVSKIEDGDLDMVMKNRKKVEEKFAGRGLKKYAEMAKITFGMLKDYKKGTFTKVPWFSMAAVTFGLLYVLNPFDIMPDFIPGLGYVDDFAVFTVILRFIESDLHYYLDWKIDQAKAGS